VHKRDTRRGARFFTQETPRIASTLATILHKALDALTPVACFLTCAV
jgi:hypothetical protein